MYYKGTEKQCENYNVKVSKGEKYQGVTDRWALVNDYEGKYYILANEKYSSTLSTVDAIPYKIEENEQP